MRTTACFLVLASVGLALGVGATRLFAPPAAAGQRARRAAATRPASRPAARPATAPATYPSPALVRATEAAAAKLKKRLDGSFHVMVSPPFVVAGNLPRRELRAYMRGTIVGPAGAMWASYFDAKPDKVITALLIKDETSYRAWARRLFNDRDVSYFGYYKPAVRTMVMNIHTGGGTLVHELTHALVEYDFPNVPTWFNEGLGSLHEQCDPRATRIIGLENWRLPALQKAVGAGTLRSLRDLVVRRDFRGRLEGINYAHARYFVLYMQRLKLLRKFYKHFRGAYTGRGADDAKAIEHVFGKKIGVIDREFVAWVKTLQYKGWTPGAARRR